MKKLLFALLLLFAITVQAQQNHYIYIQTDNKQPFYVKLNNKVFSSAGAGYVIVPKLIDGTYNLDLGFPKVEWPEQHFSIKIEKKDEGFMFKNFGDKGWGLFNMQSLHTIMGSSKEVSTVVGTKSVNDDAFSNTLSNVVNDPNILVKEPVQAETKIVSGNEAKPAITKLGSTNKPEGTELVYTDKANEKVDTVTVLIPTPPKAIDEPVVQKPKTAVIENKPGKLTMINSDCKKMASEDDFIKLRKKMIGENNDDDMITVARKTFKTRCFTTEQVKNLAVLFLKDDGRYRLFDAAYPFISDTGNFGTLESMLTEEYYTNRFKALITKH